MGICSRRRCIRRWACARYFAEALIIAILGGWRGPGNGQAGCGKGFFAQRAQRPERGDCEETFLVHGTRKSTAEARDYNDQEQQTEQQKIENGRTNSKEKRPPQKAAATN